MDAQPRGLHPMLLEGFPTRFSWLARLRTGRRHGGMTHSAWHAPAPHAHGLMPVKAPAVTCNDVIASHSLRLKSANVMPACGP